MKTRLPSALAHRFYVLGVTFLIVGFFGIPLLMAGVMLVLPLIFALLGIALLCAIGAAVASAVANRKSSSISS